MKLAVSKMLTERIYYTQAYRTRMQSRVSGASEDGLRITLDSTVFYPTSGGQPHDTGTLNGIPVIDVAAEGDAIVHVLSAPLVDLAVDGEITWTRRYDHMQQHTGQHLLSAVFEELFGFSTLSFHMGSETSTVDLETADLTPGQMTAAVNRATALARSNPLIKVSFEDAAEVQGLRKVSTRGGILRIVEIPQIDKSACGGTHVASLAEVLPLQLHGVERVRGNVRVSFCCGDREIARTQDEHLALSQQVTTLQQRLAESEKIRQRLELEAATRAGLDLYSAGHRRLLIAESVIDDTVRAKAKAFASQPGAVLLMHSAESLLIACSPDSGINAGAVLKKSGARGGGSSTLAQGSLPDGSVLRNLRDALGL